MDLTELPGLDNLRYPKGVIYEAESLTSALYGVKRTFFLTQGSTCGLMAALLAVLKPGQSVLIPRNSHVSIINGLILADVNPIYMPVEIDIYGIVTGVSQHTLRKQLQAHPDVAAVVLVHPSYDGRALAIESMIKDIHAAGLPAIIDEAHGAHLHFHEKLPVSSVDCGADIVVQSAHKTLAALTGAAWVHIQGNRVEEEKLEAAIQLLHSTSPSYLTLASLDACRSQLAYEGSKKLECLRHKINHFYNHIQGLNHVKILNQDDDGIDFTKLTLHIMSKTPSNWVNTLQKEGIYPEKIEGNNVLLLTSLADERQNWSALAKVLKMIDEDLKDEVINAETPLSRFPPTQCKLKPRDVFFASKEWISLVHSVGRVVATPVMLYPPGIPILLPGELITLDIINFINKFEAKRKLQGLQYQDEIYIQVIV